MRQPSDRTRRRKANRKQHRAVEESRARWLLIAGGGVLAAVAAVVVVLAASRVFRASPTAGGDIEPALAMRLAGGGHSIGSSAARVSVLEFADFQCPYCAAFWAGPLQQLKREFVETGLVRLVYRHALVVGPESSLAAEAAECAADQGQFFAYHDVLFESQGPENAGYLSSTRLSQFAGRAGLDVSAFDRCLVAGTHRNRVMQESSEARAAGVDSTPSVYVNGRRVSNPFDWQALRAAIVAAGGGG